MFCANVAVLLGTPAAYAVRARVRCTALAVVLRRRFGHALGAVHVSHACDEAVRLNFFLFGLNVECYKIAGTLIISDDNASRHPF